MSRLARRVRRMEDKIEDAIANGTEAEAALKIMMHVEPWVSADHFLPVARKQDNFTATNDIVLPALFDKFFSGGLFTDWQVIKITGRNDVVRITQKELEKRCRFLYLVPQRNKNDESLRAESAEKGNQVLLRGFSEKKGPQRDLNGFFVNRFETKHELSYIKYVGPFSDDPLRPESRPLFEITDFPFVDATHEGYFFYQTGRQTLDGIIHDVPLSSLCPPEVVPRRMSIMKTFGTDDEKKRERLLDLLRDMFDPLIAGEDRGVTEKQFLIKDLTEDHPLLQHLRENYPLPFLAFGADLILTYDKKTFSEYKGSGPVLIINVHKYGSGSLVPGRHPVLENTLVTETQRVTEMINAVVPGVVYFLQSQQLHYRYSLQYGYGDWTLFIKPKRLE